MGSFNNCKKTSLGQNTFNFYFYFNKFINLLPYKKMNKIFNYFIIFRGYDGTFCLYLLLNYENKKFCKKLLQYFFNNNNFFRKIFFFFLLPILRLRFTHKIFIYLWYIYKVKFYFNIFMYRLSFTSSFN